MKEKWRALLARFPRLTRGQRLVRNVVLCVILAVVAYVGYFGAPPMPMEWQFRQAEKAALVTPAGEVTVLKVKDALKELERRYGEALPDLEHFSGSNRGDSVALGERDGGLHVLVRHAGRGGSLYLTGGLPDSAVFLFDTFDFLTSPDPSAAALAVLTQLPAAAAEAEYTYTWDGFTERLTGSAQVKDGAALLILLGEGGTEAPTDAARSGVLHLTLRDSAGQVVYERTGALSGDYQSGLGYGGWIDEN